MAANVTQLHIFRDDVSPLKLNLLDGNYSALQTAVNTLNNFSNFLVDTGTPNNLNVTTASGQFVSYSDGLEVLVRIGNTNTGACTLNVNNMGPVPVLFPNALPLGASALLARSIQGFVYNASLNAFQLSGMSGGSITVTSPFTVTDPTGDNVFSVRVPPVPPPLGQEACVATISPAGTVHAQQHILCLNGATDGTVLQVWSAQNQLPGTWLAEFHGAGWGLNDPTIPPGYPGPVPGTSNGIQIRAGTNDVDYALQVYSDAQLEQQDVEFFALIGDGSGRLGPAPNQLVWDDAGHFTLTGTATLPWPALDLLADITITAPAQGQVLSYQAATQHWVNAAPITALHSLTDVLLSGTVPGQVLTYDGVRWINAGITGQAFLNTVSVPSPQTGQVLTWDGGGWVAASPGDVTTIALTSLSDVNIQSPLNRQVLTWDAPTDRWVNLPTAEPYLATLPDVQIASVTQSQVLAWDAVDNRWENTSLPGGEVIALGALMDVVLATPTANQAFIYDAVNQRWVNASALGPGLTWNATGSYAIAAPTTTGAALTVSGTSVGSSVTLQINGALVTGQGRGLGINAGTNAGDWGIWLRNSGYSQTYFQVWGDGHGTLGPSLTNCLSWNAAGAYTIAAPTSGTALVVNGVSTANAVIIESASSAAVVINGPALHGSYTTWQASGTAAGYVGSRLGVIGIGAATDFCVASATGALSLGTNGAERLVLNSDGSGVLGPNGTNNLSWSTSGGFNIAAPVPGNTTLSLHGALNAVAALSVGAANNTSGGAWVAKFVNSGSVAGDSNGLLIEAGMNASDFALDISRQDVSASLFRVRGDGNVALPSIQTGSASPANVTISTGGWLAVTTSARRYKHNVRSVTRERARAIVQALRPVTFNSLCEADDPKREIFGLVAEEVAAIEPALTTADRDGNPAGVQYDRVMLVLVTLIQELLGMDEPQGESYG